MKMVSNISITIKLNTNTAQWEVSYSGATKYFCSFREVVEHLSKLDL